MAARVSKICQAPGMFPKPRSHTQRPGPQSSLGGLTDRPFGRAPHPGRCIAQSLLPSGSRK
jgi:hypothetical protein